jgi:hypothetical protein
MSFDISKFKQVSQPQSRYERRLTELRNKGHETASIERTVSEALANVQAAGNRPFVIYGEPQSGKTEMMIALTARLLDHGARMVIVLLNDSVQLLNQNLSRFRRAGLDPAPRSFAEILDPAVSVDVGEFVVFCKKNGRDLRKLIDKVDGVKHKFVIDDEADYATPNAAVNKGERTKINQLIGDLLGNNGTYIGVTATPARLDLNRTFDNETELWVDFPPHTEYKGHSIFFPTDIDAFDTLAFRLTLMPDERDQPQFLRTALFGFLVNVAALNRQINTTEANYSMLVHTSGRRVDHSEDYRQLVDTFNLLKSPTVPKFAQYTREMWDIASERYGAAADDLVTYVISNINRNAIIVMNSDDERRTTEYETATNPATLFTVIVGGNIVSRGVTFDNLLSMFFTRDVKHKIQQDTYIQRARMFGRRLYDLKYFELTIPESLYLDWHRCFIFHTLALGSRRSGNGSPVWLEDARIAAVASSSVDQARVDMDSGEMSFHPFQYSTDVEQIVVAAKPGLTRLQLLAERLGEASVPAFLREYIGRFSPAGDESIAIHASKSIMAYSDADKVAISRDKGLIGKSDREESKYPKAVHHLKIFFNDKGRARVFYRYHGNIRFLRARGQ